MEKDLTNLLQEISSLSENDFESYYYLIQLAHEFESLENEIIEKQIKLEFLKKRLAESLKITTSVAAKNLAVKHTNVIIWKADESK